MSFSEYKYSCQEPIVADFGCSAYELALLHREQYHSVKHCLTPLVHPWIISCAKPKLTPRLSPSFGACLFHIKDMRGIKRQEKLGKGHSAKQDTLTSWTLERPLTFSILNFIQMATEWFLDQNYIWADVSLVVRENNISGWGWFWVNMKSLFYERKTQDFSSLTDITYSQELTSE